MEQLGNVFCVLHRSTENHRSFIPGVLEPSIHNELIPFWDINLALDTYQKILSYFKPAFILGLTATPERADDKNILEIFKNTAHKLDIQTAAFLYNFFQQELLFKTTPLQCLFLPNLLQLLPSPASSPDY